MLEDYPALEMHILLLINIQQKFNMEVMDHEISNDRL